MHLNAAGSAAMGFATVSVNGATPAALVGQNAGNPDGPSWLSATEIAYNNYTSGASVEKYDVVGLTRTTLTANGANIVAAGATIWGSGLKSSPSNARSNVPGHTGPISGAMLGDVSDDGELAVVTTYPNFVGLTVYSAAGATLLSLPSVTINPMAGTGILRIRDHLLVYIDASAGWTMANVTGGAFSYAPRMSSTPINWTVPVTTAGGATFVLETSDILTVRYANKGTGWQLMPTGTLAFNPDIIELSPGVLRIGWSANAGESADALHLLDLTVATGATVNWVVSGGVLVSSAGPTLTPTTFPIGPLQGSGTGGSVQAPLQHPVTDTATGDRVTKPWAMFFQGLQTGQASNTQAIASQPATTAPGANFGIVTVGSTPVASTASHDTLTLTSANGSIVLTGNATAKTIDLAGVWVKAPAVTLTNAQFKALAHPTPITIVANPGSGFWIADFRIPFQARFSAGAYTNVNAAAFMNVQYTSTDLASNYVANDATLTPARSYLTLLTSASNLVGVFTPYQDTVETNQWGNLVSIVTTVDNCGLELVVDNAGAGDFTGGHAANTFVLRPYVLIVPLP